MWNISSQENGFPLTYTNLIAQGILNCKKQSLQVCTKLDTFCKHTVTFIHSRMNLFQFFTGLCDIIYIEEVYSNAQTLS